MKWKKSFYNCFIITIGSIISGVSIHAFMVPHQLLSSGVAGLAIIGHLLFDWPIGLQTIFINVPLFIIAYRLIDKEYVIYSLYGMLIFAISVDATDFLDNHRIVNDIILSSICGGIVLGVGLSLNFSVKGSAGGLDIVAAIAKKYFFIDMGLASFIVNSFIMLIAAFLFGLQPALYTLMSMYVSAIVIDKFLSSLNRKRTLMIFSENSQDISAILQSKVGHNITLLKTEGAYSKLNTQIILLVVTRTQIARVKSIVQQIDPLAFIVIQNAIDADGTGI